MPIPIDYPHDLLPAPLVGKQRSVQQTYDTRENFDGKMLTRKNRDSSTVYFDVSFLVPYEKTVLMALWLEGVDDATPFKMTLKTEGGFNEYNCTWKDVPLSPNESNGYYTYTGTIYADKLLQGWENSTEQEKDDYWDYLVANDFYDPLDIAVNERWPEQ